MERRLAVAWSFTAALASQSQGPERSDRRTRASGLTSRSSCVIGPTEDRIPPWATSLGSRPPFVTI